LLNKNRKTGATAPIVGENFNQIEQLVQPAKLIVREDQAEKAREMLKDLNIRYLGIASMIYEEDEKE
jgi:hypothetical protein